MENKSEKLIYLALIVLMVVFLSSQVLNSGKTINRLIRENDESKLFNIGEIPDSGNEAKNIANLENKFTTAKKDLSFNYSSGWREVEDENILNIFLNPGMQSKYAQEYADDTVNVDDLGELADSFSIDQDHVGEIKFLATKTSLPTFSLGIISLQDLKKEGETVENLKKLLIDEIEYEDESTTTEIKNTLSGEYFVLLESVSKIDNRPVFKSINLGLINEKSTYLITFASAYETWQHFETEFNMIISSIEFDGVE